MAVRRSRIALELLALALVIGAIGATVASIVAIQQNSLDLARLRSKPPTVVLPSIVETKVEPAPVPPPLPIPLPPIDPTPELVAKLASARDEERKAALDLDAKAIGLEEARRRAEVETKALQRHEMLARTQLESLDQKARRLEEQASMFELERDVLAMERDEAKAALVKAQHRSSHAVMPHRGSNGTWQRPIVIECVNGEAIVAPNGPRFTLLELASLANVRGSRFAELISRLALDTQRSSAPDGSAVVPYIFFLVRPDGVRPFYEARSCLEPLGIAFGYELVDQDWEIDVPNLEKPADWGEEFAKPTKAPRLAESARPTTDSTGDGPGSYVWPSQRAATPRLFSSVDPAHATVNRRAPGLVAQADTRPQGRGSGTGLQQASADGKLTRQVGSKHDGSPASLDDLKQGDSSGSSRLGPSQRGGSVSGRSLSGSEEGSDDSPTPFLSPREIAEINGAPRSRGGPELSELGLSASGSETTRFEDAKSDPNPSRTGGSAGKSGSGKSNSQRAVTSRENSEAQGSGSPSGGQPGGSPGIPTLSFDAGPESDSAPARSRGYKESEPLPRPTRTLEIQVVCGPDGVLLYPGAYRLTAAALAADPERLPKQLAAILNEQALRYQEIRWRPSLVYKVGAGGNSIYWDVRRQTIIAAASWPSRVEMAETTNTAFAPGGRLLK